MEEKKWTKEEIKTLLEKSDKAVVRGLLVIYSLQTEDERMDGEAHGHNGVGFTKFDADFMSSLAKQLITKDRLSEKQLTYARKRILKYASQLTKVANGELKVDVVEVKH